MVRIRGSITLAARLAVVVASAAFVLSCDDSSGYSSSSYSSALGRDSNGELQAAVDEFEAARQELAAVAFDDGQKAQYAAAVDAELARLDFDFNGVLQEETKSRTRFRDMFLDACRARGISPPSYLSRLGAPFDTKGASIDWGSEGFFSSGSSNTELPESVRRWIAKQGETVVDPLRQKVTRLTATHSVASKILELALLRSELQKKLHEAQTLLRRFESDIDKIQQEVRRQGAGKAIITVNAAMNVQAIRNDLEKLRSKRAYVRYLTRFVDALKAGTMDLQSIEEKSRDEFAMTKLVGGEESRRLVDKIDLALSKYNGAAFDQKLEVDVSETPQDIWLELQRTETTQ